MGRGIWQAGHLISAVCLFAVCPGGFTQNAAKPRCIALEPKSGNTTPGTTVRVLGEGFSSETVVYFGGLEARGTRFIDPNTLEVITPYLRPGEYQLQLKSEEAIIRSDVTFRVSPSTVDIQVDRALTLAGHGQTADAIALLKQISEANPDPQVRAFSHYQIGQVYYAEGDLWRWGGETASVFDPTAGRAIQTWWRYRLSYDLSTYLLPIESDPDTPLRLIDGTVENDVTQDPEPRFFRGLLNARFGNPPKAKADCDYILMREPHNPSYRALAAYVAALRGDKTALQSFTGQKISDPRALGLLGEAAYLSGDTAEAHVWWEQAAKIDSSGASLAYWAGKKHLARGQSRVAESLLSECVVMAPESKEAKEARELLAKM